MDHIGNVILGLAIVAGGFVLVVWSFARGDQILDKWAADNGYKIVKREYKFFWNILAFPATNSQSIYRN